MSTDNEKEKIDAAMLMDSIGGIDEDLLREADSFRNGNVVAFKPKKKKAPGYIALPIAAAAVLVVGIIAIGRFGMLSPKNSASESAAPSYSDSAMFDSAATDSAAEEDWSYDSDMMEDVASESSITDEFEADTSAEATAEVSEGTDYLGLDNESDSADFTDNNAVAEVDDLSEFVVDLPEGYTFEEYENIYSYRKGMLILPMQYESDSAPDYRRASGSWSEIQTEAGVYVNVRFDENGVPTEDSGIVENHTTTENIKTYKCEELAEGWYCIEYFRKYDLYSAAELANGVTGDETSDYYVFLFVKEDADMYYELTLSAKCFSLEEAEKIAKSVKIN